LTLLGWLLSEQGKNDEARETFRRSLDLKADQFLAAFNYAILSLRAAMARWACAGCAARLPSSPIRSPAWRTLALELARQDRKDEALPVAERSLRLAPDDAELQGLIRKLKGGARSECADQTSIEHRDAILERRASRRCRRAPASSTSPS
jgi:tetratricopeptide (TPR) repeat protein